MSSPNFWSRRTVLKSIAKGGVGLMMLSGSVAKVADADRSVRLPDYRRPGDIDDTAALLRAAASGRPVYAPAGGGSGQGGAYLIGTTAEDNLPSQFSLFGDGIDKTIIAQSYARPAPFILHADSRSADVAHNLRGMRLRDLTFQDEVTTRGFSEHNYLVMLNGVTEATIERVCFRGFRGDGLYIGSSTIKSSERHNRAVTIRDCIFDGVNANNRNGISIIDCDGLTISHCRFLNVSRQGGGGGSRDAFNVNTGGMEPGPIDLEPDDNAFAVIRNVTISDNYFRGGGGYAVCLNLRANDFLTTPHANFRIERNRIEQRFGGISAAGFGQGDAETVDRPYAVSIVGNTVSDCTKPFLIQGMRGIALRSNRFADCAEMAELGYGSNANADVELTGNRFERVGGVKGYGLWVRRGNRLKIGNNVFDDCGRADGQSGVAIAFIEGRMRNISLTGNHFLSPTGRTRQTTRVFREAAVDFASIQGNTVGKGIIEEKLLRK